jgi:hypothetical protein
MACFSDRLSGFSLIVRSTIEYPNYKFHFAIRALGRYEHEYIPAMKELIEN